MTTYYSDQITNERAVPRVLNSARDKGGRVRCANFDYTVPTGNIATSSTVQLCKVPAGARLLGGFFAATAMSSDSGDASIQIGDGTTAAKYLGTTSVDSAAAASFGVTKALGYGEELTAELIVTATVVTEAWVAAGVISGHVLYVLD